jgi:hypothetical protein
VRHSSSNPNCDKNQYGEADGVKCTCDIDSPDDSPVPSTVLPVGATTMNAVACLPGSREAAAYAELKAAARELDAARQMLKPAEERWRRALDALHEEMLRR